MGRDKRIMEKNKEEEILKKAIGKAIEKGYSPPWWLCEFNVIDPKDDAYYFSDNTHLEKAQERFEWHKKTFSNNRPAILGIYPKMDYYYQIIFSYEFAIAFWGETPLVWGCYCCGDEANANDDKWHKLCDCQNIKRLGVKKWKWHLQQMVLEEKPLEYLEKFIND